MLSLGQRLIIAAVGIILFINLILFFPWWIAAVGIIAALPFFFAIFLK